MIVVMGCGNAARSDDGVGPAVVRALACRPIANDPDVRLLDAGTDGMAVLFAARGCEVLLIVDASRSGAEPGAVFEVPGDELERQHQNSLTLHDFRWDHALYAARRMFGASFPTMVKVLLVEANTVQFGLELSPVVAASAEKVADRIETLVQAYLHERAHVA